MKCYSAMKKNAFESILMRWMNLEPVLQTEVSQKEKNKYFILTHMYGIQRRRQWQPTLVLLPGKSHGQRSLVGCSPWGREGSDMTERLHFHFSLSCIEEGHGNPLQCSCLENLRDGVAWWAAVYGVSQSWTRLKRLSSSSSMESRKMALTNLIAGQQWRCRHREQTCRYSEVRRGWGRLKECQGEQIMMQMTLSQSQEHLVTFK